MKYEMDKTGEAGKLYLEGEDILSAAPVRSREHAVEVVVRYRKQYQADPTFEWQGGSRLRVPLLARQVQSLVEQDRDAQSAFCNPCYDYGKRERPPASCVRCLLLEACRKSGKGDFRKIRPAAQIGPGNGMAIALLFLLLCFWWAVYQWGAASVQLDAANRELKLVKEERTPKR